VVEWWGNAVYEYYAATEGGGTLVTPQEWMKYPGTVGKAWPNAEIRIFDDAENDVPTGGQGTVYMKLGETGKFEYKGDEQKTRKNRIVKDDTLYFTVGDIGYLNEDGYLFLSTGAGLRTLIGNQQLQALHELVAVGVVEAGIALVAMIDKDFTPRVRQDRCPHRERFERQQRQALVG